MINIPEHVGLKERWFWALPQGRGPRATSVEDCLDWLANYTSKLVDVLWFITLGGASLFASGLNLSLIPKYWVSSFNWFSCMDCWLQWRKDKTKQLHWIIMLRGKQGIYYLTGQNPVEELCQHKAIGVNFSGLSPQAKKSVFVFAIIHKVMWLVGTQNKKANLGISCGDVHWWMDATRIK